MGYEEFKMQNPLARKIAQNALKFGVDALANETLVAQFISQQTLSFSADERANLEEIFASLMAIEQDVQLSK